MLDTIINKNLIFLQKHGIAMETEDDKDVYKYGLQLIYSYIINISIILSISACFHRLYQTSIMIFVFAILQAFGGGYHAKTKFKCLSLMIIGSIAGNILIDIILNHNIFMIVSAVALSVVILVLGPVKNKNHPISKKTFKRSKSVEKFIILLILSVIVLLLNINKNTESAAIISTLYLYTISLIVAKTKEIKTGGKNVFELN